MEDVPSDFSTPHAKPGGNSKKQIRVNLAEQFESSLDVQSLHPEKTADDNVPLNYSISLESITQSSTKERGTVPKHQETPRGMSVQEILDSSTPSSILKTTKSPKQVRIVESSQQAAAATIKEMENIRAHLQDVLHPSDDHHVDSENGMRYEGGITGYDDDSHSTMEAAALLRSYFPHSSPLELDSDGVFYSTAAFQASKEKASTLLSLQAENAILQDSITKEKSRRRHCEDQIQELHHKLLNAQQQLAVAATTDRKKEIMIEQLDKTLAKVVDGWKNHEEERVKAIKVLKDENLSLQKSHGRHEEVLAQFERDLSQAVEALTKEQQRTEAIEKEKESKLKQLHDQLGSQAVALEEANSRRASVVDENETLARQVEQLNQKLAQNKEEQNDDLQRLNNDISDLKMSFAIEQERLEQSVNQKQMELEEISRHKSDIHSELNAMRHKIKEEELKLEAEQQEKIALRAEIDLLESKYESLESQKELELKTALEKEFNAKINQIHIEIDKTENELREAHRKQIQEIINSHKNDLESQMNVYKQELKRREDNFIKAKGIYESKLSEACNTNQELQACKEKLDKQREGLAYKLQRLMQQHCEETISLFSGNSPKPMPASKMTMSIDNGSKANQSWMLGSHNNSNHPVFKVRQEALVRSPDTIPGNNRMHTSSAVSSWQGPTARPAIAVINTFNQEPQNDKKTQAMAADPVTHVERAIDHSYQGPSVDGSFINTTEYNQSGNEDSWLMRPEEADTGDVMLLDTAIERRPTSNNNGQNREDELSLLIHKLLQRSPTDDNANGEEQPTHMKQALQFQNDSQTTPVNRGGYRHDAFKRSVVRNGIPSSHLQKFNQEVLEGPSQLLQNVSVLTQSAQSGHRSHHSQQLQESQAKSVGVEEISGMLKLLGLVPDSDATRYLHAVAGIHNKSDVNPTQYEGGHDKEIPVKLRPEINLGDDRIIQKNNTSHLDASVSSDLLDEHTSLLKPQRRSSPTRSQHTERKVIRSSSASGQYGKPATRRDQRRTISSQARGMQSRRTAAWK